LGQHQQAAFYAELEYDLLVEAGPDLSGRAACVRRRPGLAGVAPTRSMWSSRRRYAAIA